MSGIILTEDERACVHRALSLRRDALRSEMLYMMERPPEPQITAARQIIETELEVIARCIRAMWIGTGGNNGNYMERT
jgi:hypothetical protein